jgi:tetratricopeptide (TPR) repeat protein
MSCRDARDRLRRACPLVFMLLLLSCRAGPEQIPLQVEYSGCWAVYIPGPVCALQPGPDSTLSLWVKADPGAEAEVLADGQRLPAAGEDIQNGRRYRLSIPPGASSLTVRLPASEGAPTASWSLRLAPPETPWWWAEIQELRHRGQNKQAIQRLTQLRKTAPRAERGLILGSLGGLAYQMGNFEEARAFLLEGIAADRADKRLDAEVQKAAFLARAYSRLGGRFDLARQTLAALRLPPEAPAESKYQVAYNQGLLSKEVGEYRTALEQLRKAADLADRVGMAEWGRQAEQPLAVVLQDVGRSHEAEELFAHLRADSQAITPCDVGVLLTNWGWSRLLAREGGEEAPDPTPMLEEARSLFDANTCARPEQRLNARLNVAFAFQQAHRWREARRALEEVRPLAAQASLSERLWWPDLEGRVAIAEGRAAQALRLYDGLGRLAERVLSPQGRFRACLGRARARLALGDRATAITDLAEAERRIDEQASLIPLHEGRDTFVGQREEAPRLHLQLLLEEGQRDAAFTLARQSRSRLLRQLLLRDQLAQLTPGKQREWDRALVQYRELRATIDRESAQDWQLPEDQVQRTRAAQLAKALEGLDRAVGHLGRGGEGRLQPPRPGEVILAYHPLPQGWVGFAAGQRGVEVSTFNLSASVLADPVELSRRLLEPFRAAIEHAGRVRVLPYGRLRSIDFHALPFGREPLLAGRPVVYGLDLPAHASSPVGRHEALLVSDPQRDLPAAREEAAVVATAVRGWAPPWNLRRLDGTAAGAEAVREALEKADLFHYAGHGTFAGFAGWDSVLRLADGSRLTLGDLLALRRVPPWVVLSACDAGRSSEDAPGEGIGIAYTFLLRGTEAVIAANRPVPDRTARDLIAELYRGWQPGTDLERAFQRAQLASRQQDPAADWASFRLIEP